LADKRCSRKGEVTLLREKAAFGEEKKSGTPIQFKKKKKKQEHIFSVNQKAAITGRRGTRSRVKRERKALPQRRCVLLKRRTYPNVREKNLLYRAKVLVFLQEEMKKSR